MLKVGDRAPEFSAVATNGETIDTRMLRGKKVVVYFFPKAFTPGCTVETRLFRDNFNEIKLAGATLVGVSTDDLETQCSFAESMRAPFPLIGDHDQKIASAFDVLWPMIGLARRVTYVLGASRVVEAVFRHELFVKSHRNDVLRFVNDKFLRSRPKD
jgi:peroxiredoxin